jgi:hypothetical protein
LCDAVLELCPTVVDEVRVRALTGKTGWMNTLVVMRRLRAAGDEGWVTDGPVVQLFVQSVSAVVATSTFAFAAAVYLAASARLDQTEDAIRARRVDIGAR